MISLNLFSPWFQWEQAVLWRGRRWDLILRGFSDVCWAHYIPKKVPFLPGPTSAENPGTIEFVSFHMLHDTGICTYYVYLFIYVFIYLYLFICLFICLYIYCIYLFVCLFIYLFIYLLIYWFIYLFIHICIYTYINIYIYIYIYTYTPTFGSFLVSMLVNIPAPWNTWGITNATKVKHAVETKILVGLSSV